MKHILILSGVAAAALAAGAVSATQPPARGADVTRAQVIERTDAAFARLDANRDGRFTREEAQALRQQHREQRMTRMFERLDANDDGQISREEFAQGRRGARGPGGPGPMADAGADGQPGPGRGWRRGRGPGGPGMGPGMRMGGRMFGEAGYMTAEQFRARALARFDRADANRDGTLTVAERQAQREQRRGHRRHGAPGAPAAPTPAQ